MTAAKKKRGDVRPHGQIRQSQIVTTFGPGAMIDLPDYAVILSGLDHWSGYEERPIVEDRLAAKVRNLLGRPFDFYAPPADRDDPTATVTGVTVWLFPEWFVVQNERRDESGVRSRPLVHRLDLDRGMTHRLEARDKPQRVVPVRFVQACTRGHVSDIDWRVFVHGKGVTCTRRLWMDERGTTGDLTDITIRCECGLFKALSAAAKIADVPLGFCNGPRPWLGPNARERCGDGADRAVQPNRLLVRAASNAYFAQTLSAISIPEPGLKLRSAVEAVWTDYLQVLTSIELLAIVRNMPAVKLALEGFSDVDVWAEMSRRRQGAILEVKGIREAEIETLLQSPDQVGEDQPDGWFFARTVPVPSGQPPLTRAVSRLVKVHRLREVIVQVGFTRFESAVPDVNGELALDVERAALSLNQQWLPAVENRGEGVFIGFSSADVEAWEGRSPVVARGKRLLAGFAAWQKDHQANTAIYPGVKYVMLHTLSHLLITAVALDCGYAASSIRERIYVSSAGYGILLYTAGPDAEGTLGGLVEAADRIDSYLRQAIDLGRLCSNDPVCAQHQPDSRQEDRLLSGAACHGCVLLAESSCERRNDFLDRALVVPTVDDESAAFFDADVA
jgi:hypothetical protein